MTAPAISQQRGPRSSDENEAEHAIEEDHALLTGQPTGKPSPPPSALARSKWREIGLFVWAVVASAAVIVLAVVYQHSGVGRTIPHDPPHAGGKRNLIFMVSDGMGPSSLSLTRSWKQITDHAPYDRTLFLDNYLIGQSRTRSSNSLVTDSAAGATAFSCGSKSYNGAISILPDFEPCASVMEAAKRAGYTTGLVVTTRITDATPAVFAAHARSRAMEDSIALQMVGETHPLGRVVDLMMGGGRCHFLPNTTEGSCRHDGRNVVDVARNLGWSYLDNKREFNRLGKNVDLPLMALFADEDLPYEIDRRHEAAVYPSLEEMTKTALHALSTATKHKEQGFFIMIEGSRIDHAGHANDPAAQVHEVQAYDRAMRAVIDFIEADQKATGTPTLMISTSDHETGGLAVAKQLTPVYPKYLWLPSVLANASHSAHYASYKYHSQMSTRQPHGHDPDVPMLKDYLLALAREDLGIWDCADAELDQLIHHPAHATYTFADMISRRAQLGWSTHGHSAADVNIYASDREVAANLTGNRENTDIGVFLRRYLGVEAEVEAIARELREHAKVGAEGGDAWLGSVPVAGERLDGQDHLDHYHGNRRQRCELCGGGGGMFQ
ncbi:alkaline-phosphatase-like protein [Neohortaea acidophila]|uniref:Alkaline phosphatase n=1 Tax=Neohortaea acidophila TaxID=245834 RepID=A0A6A6PK13_9PEZI|nr:alkaline-phosphatase-like protein [Neohortaea acidophila]KAF2480418.1 alkaline-phosphatase-like protein [Neohortaea acidophila]